MVVQNCQCIIDSQKAGTIYEHIFKEHRDSHLIHRGVPIIGHDRNYHIGELRAERYILCGGGVALAERFYPGKSLDAISSCHYLAFKCQVADIWPLLRQASLELHFPADALYCSSFDLGSGPRTAPYEVDALDRYLVVLERKDIPYVFRFDGQEVRSYGTTPQLIITYWQTTDQLLAALPETR